MSTIKPAQVCECQSQACSERPAALEHFVGSCVRPAVRLVTVRVKSVVPPSHRTKWLTDSAIEKIWLCEPCASFHEAKTVRS